MSEQAPDPQQVEAAFNALIAGGFAGVRAALRMEYEGAILAIVLGYTPPTEEANE